MKHRMIGLFLLVCMTAAFVTGCAPKNAKPMGTPAPTSAPTERATERATDAPSPEASASAGAEVSVSPSAGASETAGADEISGFMEGGIVDPEDVPDVAKIFADGAEYAGSEIQSITYKLHEGRQTYYVVLQGTGGERRYYVFPDMSVIPAEEPKN